MKLKFRLGLVALVLVLFASACGGDDDADPEPSASATQDEKVTLSISAPAEAATINGNTAVLDMELAGIDIKAADGDTSGKTGHYHVFIDREPVAVGETIPKEPGIVHSADDPITVPGLAIGAHALTVVLGDGAHKRIEEVQAKVNVNIAGPTLDVNAPAEIAVGAKGRIDVVVAGVQLVPGATDTGAPRTTGHIHYLIDPASAPVANGQPLPPEEPNKVIHTVNTVYDVQGDQLAAGEHTIWVVLGDKNHVPYEPLVADKVTITIK